MKTRNNQLKYLKDVRELLIIIDMVNGFIKEGVLASPSIKRIIPRQIELIKEGLNNDDTGIVFIRDTHTTKSTEFKTYPSHCIVGTSESMLIDELKPFEKDALNYQKNSTNLIFAPGIQDDLKKLNNLNKVRLMGCLSDVCVINGAIGLKTFFDEINKDVGVYVHADAIDTFDTLDHNANDVNEKSLQNMENNGIMILRK